MHSNCYLLIQLETQARLAGPQAWLAGPLAGPLARLAGPQARLTGPQAWLTGPQAWLTGPHTWLDGLEREKGTDGQKIYPFYSSSSPIGPAALLSPLKPKAWLAG